MNVKNISWISKDASEAIVTVVDNKNFGHLGRCIWVRWYVKLLYIC